MNKTSFAQHGQINKRVAIAQIVKRKWHKIKGVHNNEIQGSNQPVSGKSHSQSCVGKKKMMLPHRTFNAAGSAAAPSG